ncbi:MAG: LLM class flavin-dependent oxidoreductase [Dehalococcoidia bacterium]|nr:LLM class flavin-dependent oxidoreductase [Dehalococcoidia bacterium]MSQ17350.1 LLM class flavin-dependent oxidoreductase [Dehalococcoidia bacterium]
MTASQQRPAPLFDWFIPIDGDGARAGTLRAQRPPAFPYLRQVAQTAEDCGFHSLLIPTRFANGLFAEDAPLAETWTTATALAAVTKRIRFLVAVRPGFVSLGLFAQMAAALDQISQGRLDLNVVPGGIQNDFERLGEVSDHATRYERAEEFMAACRKLWREPGPVEFHGQFYRLDGAYCVPAPQGESPRFYLGGVSDRAMGLSARQADVHLAWIEPLSDMARRLDSLRRQFQQTGRNPGLGLRTHLVVRDTEDAAWSAARELIDFADPAVRAQRQSAIVGTPMVGQQAQARQAVDHRLAPHLWNGLSEVRVNCGSAIVGAPEQVAEELLAYWRLGFDEFILSGFPHVEECRRVASQVVPLLRDRIRREVAGA